MSQELTLFPPWDGGQPANRRDVPTRNRTCKNCGNNFQMNTNGAGTKYCSPTCKKHGYAHGASQLRGGEPPSITCELCGTTHHTWNPRRYSTCTECFTRIRPFLKTLTNHRVPAGLASQLITDPTCPICHDDLTQHVRINSGSKMMNLTIDHNHNCCPGKRSCGKCVRGIICRRCNAAIGQAQDNPDTLERAVAYLRGEL